MAEDFILSGGSSNISWKGCGKSMCQLHSFDYLSGVPGADDNCDYVEVQFKNTRKGFFLNSNNLPLEKGDIVAVESNPGHDIGTVTMTGRLVALQMKKANLRPDIEIKRVYRKAREVDMEKYAEAKSREHDTMIRSRQIAKDLGLEMKIGDVEYQGDGNKAIFYYIADGRVDFRQLIKVLAEAFRVRIEMKQIGARQEAGRIGGIGPCGRELCCTTWMTNFISVSTSAARFQDISMNPQKLAGQCAKLKCCLNYEVDAYVEAQKRFPSRDIPLETADGTYYFFKADILNGMLSYSTDKVFAANVETISFERALEIINMNRNGQKPVTLTGTAVEDSRITSDVLDEGGLTRFDKKKKKKKKKPRPQEGSVQTESQTVDSAESASENKEKPEKQESKEKQDKPERKERPHRDQHHKPHHHHNNHHREDGERHEGGAPAQSAPKE